MEVIGDEGGEPCPGSRELEKRALDGENLRRALKKGGPRLEWKGRRDNKRRWRWRIRIVKDISYLSAGFTLLKPDELAVLLELILKYPKTCALFLENSFTSKLYLMKNDSCGKR
ncbi:UNVERIFIED_CONTAM: hypothetical protein NCL1_47057 [Trichonephila clavipes]